MPDVRPYWDKLATVFGPWLSRFLDWLSSAALTVGLWLTGLWDLAIVAWLPPAYSAMLIEPRYHKMPLLGLMVICAIIARFWARHAFRRRPVQKAAERKLRIRRQPGHRRLKLWWIHKFDAPFYWKIGKHVASLSQTHGLIIGGSGSGKSTLVVSLILQPNINWYMWLLRKLGVWARMKVVVVSFDRSDPIEEATNVIEDAGLPVKRWRVRQSAGWNLLKGDREMIAEALPLGWPSGDNTGFFQQLATDAISAALKEQDEDALARGLQEGDTREFNDMIDRMDRIMSEDDEVPALARRTWVRRFRSLARVMHESLGDDFDLSSLLADDSPESEGMVIHLSCNSYTNQALIPLVGAMAITQIKIAAEHVENVYVVFEEASFLKKRADLLDDLAKSLRARGWRIVYLNQNPQDVGDALQVNFGVAVFMGLGPLATKQRVWCADIVKEFPGAFSPGEIILNTTIDPLEGYVLLRGKCRDVSFAPYITRKSEHRVARARDKREYKITENPTVPPTTVPRVWTGTVQNQSESYGTEPRDASYGTDYRELDGETVGGAWALPAGQRPGPPEYYIKQPLLAKEWANLSGVYDPMGCWLVKKEQVNSEGRARVWVPKGTRGWGPTVEEKGGYVTGYVIVCHARRGPKPAAEVGSNGKLKEWQADHLCHTNDLHCPGGERCVHLRCMNGDHFEWVSPQVNSMRMQVRKERRRDLLAGVCYTWPNTVVEEADARIMARAA